MRQETMKIGAVGLGVFALVACLFLAGFALSPNSAQAFWWPWGKAHAQEGKHATSTVTVTIQKYVDGNLATATSSQNLSFPMTASWNDPDGVGEGSGNYELAANTSPAYQAQTTQMQKGASYTTHEILTGNNVAATCAAGKPYALVGYTSGTSLAAAQAGTPTTTAPSFTNLKQDRHVIVWNQTCTGTTTPTGDLVGVVTGGADEQGPGELQVTSIEAQKTTATANGTFVDGWRYVFNITVPTDEPNLAMKFDNWLHTNGTSTIPVANNMRISSPQANNAGATILLTAADTYSTPNLTMVGDLDPTTEGLQVRVLVEVAVPPSTLNGTYSTNYGVRTE